jgi:hypothetical protein
MNKYILTTAAIIALIPSSAKADHGSMGGASEGAGPIVTSRAETMKAGTFTASVTSEFASFDEFSDNELINRAGQHIHAHSADYLLINSLGLAYGLEGLTLSVRLPYVYRDNIRSGSHSHGPAGNTAEDHGDVGGLGDATFMGKWRFYAGEDFSSALLFGIKAPTGETGKKHDGEKLEAEHQPGSGSWDPLLGAAVTKRLGDFAVDASTLASFAQEGAQHTDLGNRVSYNLALSWRAGEEARRQFHHEGKAHGHNYLDLTLELNGEWVGKKQEDDEADPDSGGNQVFLSPGIRFTPESHWSGFLSVGIPVISNLGAGHAETDYKVTAGISKSF